MKKFILLLIFVPTSKIYSSGPIPAICTPSTTAYCCGFGILNVKFNTINNTSTNASEGYKDFSSTVSTNVYEAQKYGISVNVSGGSSSAKQNVRVYIDYNNNGILDSLAELVYTANSVSIATGTITIPSTAVKNTELRMRVVSDYELQNPPGPCGNLQQGQAEDYSIQILTNAFAPDVAFHADNTTTCSGKVSFFDDSQNLPTGWIWYFGDGAVSTKQNPTHTYLSSNTFKVKLQASNTNGSDIDSIVNYINVTLGAQPIASCAVTTLAYCCGHGITHVKLKNINNVTTDGSEGYQDYSCTMQSTLVQGVTYTVSIGTGTTNAHDVKMWIDLNNDGTLDNTNEVVFSYTNQNSPKGNITIPGSSTVYNTPLRMRVMADQVGNTLTPCTDVTWGQTEDYTVIITDPAASIYDIETTNPINVFPNPTNGIITIDCRFNENQSFTFYLYDMIGRVIMQKNEPASLRYTESFDLSVYPQGLYIFKIRGEKGESTRKIIYE